MLVVSEESLVAVGSAIRDAANGTSQNLGKIGGMDREHWKASSIEIERSVASTSTNRVRYSIINRVA